MKISHLSSNETASLPKNNSKQYNAAIASMSRQFVKDQILPSEKNRTRVLSSDTKNKKFSHMNNLLQA